MCLAAGPSRLLLRKLLLDWIGRHSRILILVHRPSGSRIHHTVVRRIGCHQLAASRIDHTAVYLSVECRPGRIGRVRLSVRSLRMGLTVRWFEFDRTYDHEIVTAAFDVVYEAAKILVRTLESHSYVNAGKEAAELGAPALFVSLLSVALIGCIQICIIGTGRIDQPIRADKSIDLLVKSILADRCNRQVI